MSVLKSKSPRIAKQKKLSRLHAPDGMSVANWQLGLRKQIAEQETYEIQNRTDRPVFSEFAVRNPRTAKTYRVAVRGEAPGANFCSCPDYAVNTLGTCKHIEAVLIRLRRSHRKALAAGYTPPYSEVYVRYGARRDVCLALGSECPPAVAVAARGLAQQGGGISPANYGEIEGILRAAHAAGHELRLYDDARELIAEQRDRAVRDRQLKQVFGASAGGGWRRLLKCELFPYQREGALFAARAGRAIIADEMGLGKTIQAIAATEILARECGAERALIICPTSLKSQWKSEIEKFCGRTATVIEGGLANRARLYRDDPAFFKVVNYDVVHRDLEAIAGWSPDLVILDEAQRIKNWQTRAAKAIKQVSSRFAIVLTGTPLENRLEELHSIVEFVDRHRLGPLFAFREQHEIREAGGTRVVGYRQLDHVNQSLAPILIRRTKQQVLSQLPERLDKNFFVPMTPPQWRHHDENREMVGRLVQKWRRMKFLTDADQLRLRISLQNMRMSCDSTYLLDQETRHGHKVAESEKLLEEVLERPDEKVVMFSQWVRMNELIGEMLDRRNWAHVHLHGGVPGSKRGEFVRRLHEDDSCRVFLSSDAGGVGLNLQRAATVVNLDLPWNPAVLEQRIARVHRLGQKRAVRVVNFIAQDTIEHGMLGLLSFKRSLFRGVLDGEAESVFLGEGAMARFMKTVETATDAIPAEKPASDDADPRFAEIEGPSSDVADTGTARAASAPILSALSQPAADGMRAGESASVAASGSSESSRAEALRDLFSLGAEFLSRLAGEWGGASAAAGERGAGRPRGPAVTVNESTGAKELRIPLPNNDQLARVAGQILEIVESLRR